MRNAVLSSEIMKDGTITVKGRLAARRPGEPDTSKNKRRSSSLVCLSIHSDSGRLRAIQRFAHRDLVLHERRQGLFLNLVHGGRHDEQGHEQRQPDEHLIGRQLRRAHRLAQKRKDDDDARERGDRKDDGGAEGQRCQDQEQLDRGRPAARHGLQTRVREIGQRRCGGAGMVTRPVRPRRTTACGAALGLRGFRTGARRTHGRGQRRARCLARGETAD
jgi:hypothetical protein